jgi:hypothetical protein
VTWLVALATGSAAYRGLPESVMAALRDETSELHTSCAAMRAAAGGLLARTQREGTVRADVTVDELLALTTGLAWASTQATGNDELIDRLLSLVTTGLATS